MYVSSRQPLKKFAWWLNESMRIYNVVFFWRVIGSQKVKGELWNPLSYTKRWTFLLCNFSHTLLLCNRPRFQSSQIWQQSWMLSTEGIWRNTFYKRLSHWNRINRCKWLYPWLLLCLYIPFQIHFPFFGTPPLPEFQPTAISHPVNYDMHVCF